MNTRKRTVNPARAEARHSLEPLEPRALLSAALGWGHHPAHALGHGPAICESPAGVKAAATHAASKAGSAAKSSSVLPEFDAGNFDAPVANPWLPLVPGTTYVYEAEEEEGLIRTRFIVTNDTKQILGVAAIVVREVEEIYIEELDQTFLLEDTFDWYAMDNGGNVWYFGEETTSFDYDEEWNLLGTDTGGSWEAGVDGARAGILMPADPSPGLTYQQEFLEGEAEDRARVLRLNATASIGLGTFTGVLKTKEWSPLSPGEVEHKYYAEGVGLIYIEELSGGKTVTVELVEIIGP